MVALPIRGRPRLLRVPCSIVVFGVRLDVHMCPLVEVPGLACDLYGAKVFGHLVTIWRVVLVVASRVETLNPKQAHRNAFWPFCIYWFCGCVPFCGGYRVHNGLWLSSCVLPCQGRREARVETFYELLEELGNRGVRGGFAAVLVACVARCTVVCLS